MACFDIFLDFYSFFFKVQVRSRYPVKLLYLRVTFYVSKQIKDNNRHKI